MNCVFVRYLAFTPSVDWTLSLQKIIIDRGRVDRASATETVDCSSIPGRAKPNTIKIGIHSYPA